MAIETAPKPQATAADEMPLHGIDHVELYVGNATQAAHWFTHALGFRCTAYAGLETGVRDRASNVVEVVISSLRRKLGDDAGTIATVRGVGYRYGRASSTMLNSVSVALRT